MKNKPGEMDEEVDRLCYKREMLHLMPVACNAVYVAPHASCM